MKRFPSISTWLLIGCVLVLGQIVIGGITRLTDSGLSITEWNVIKGTLPPLNDVEWNIAFEKYKTIAVKQFEAIHRTMTIDEFKSIYFWEYFHRLWARIMGFVFLIPFLYFLMRRRIEFSLMKRLSIVILLASLAAVFGWLMVASGLNNDKRTWVNAYNLLGHLIIALMLYSYLLYTYFKYSFEAYNHRVAYKNYSLWIWIGALLVAQFAFGALMAGMKAGMAVPYPFMVLKYQLINQIFHTNSFDWNAIYDYEPNIIIKILVQILHRGTAYLLLGLTGYFIVQNKEFLFRNFSLVMFTVLLFLQIAIGILTVSYSMSRIPIVLGVVHQTTAFLLLSSYLWVLFIAKKR